MSFPNIQTYLIVIVKFEFAPAQTRFESCNMQQINFYFWITLNVLCIPVQIVPNSCDHTDLDAWFGLISGSVMDLDGVYVG